MQEQPSAAPNAGTNADGNGENRGHVLALLPLALLETVREQDRPGEVLEDEDISVSLPRRLGLTGVVSSQIRRYEKAGSNGRVPAAEVAGLMQLVLRRPDAGSILREAGRRIAHRQLGDTLPRTARVLRRWDRMVFIPLRRAAKRLLRGIVGNVRTTISGRPLVVRMSRSPLGAAGSDACDLYTGAIAELVRMYSDRPHTVTHVQCTARGGAQCEWTVD